LGVQNNSFRNEKVTRLVIKMGFKRLLFTSISTMAASAISCASVLAQVPTEQLAKPPADAQHFVIISTAGKHGDSYTWFAIDGSRVSRESINLRGIISEVDQTGVIGPDGMPTKFTVRGVTRGGDAGETFEIINGKATWKSQIDRGSTTYTSPAFYLAQGGTNDGFAWFFERLLAMPDKTMALLPSGKAHAEKLVSIGVGTGTAKKTVTAWAVSGLSNSPIALWADADGKFFGLVGGLATLPLGYEEDFTRLQTAQDMALASQSKVLVKNLVKKPIGPVAFKNVRLFDADAGVFRQGQTVVVEKGVITSVGLVGKVKLTTSTLVIDGTGRTLVPGLWDCHMHVGNDYTGPQELSLGVTSIRDPGNNDNLTIARRNRIAKGELLFPNVYASLMIDGKGKYTAQYATVVTSQDEAIAAVQKAKSTGFVGVKFYGTFNPAWLPAAIAEAHKLGLHVHGHLPAGIRPLDAINAGYDEITHINFVIMQAMPDEVVNVSNSTQRLEGPGRYARNVNLSAEPMKSLIAMMAKRQIVVDPTLSVFEGLLVPESGDLSSAYAAFVGTLPPATERDFRQGSFAVPKDLTRADYRASFAKLKALVVTLFRAGVPIVAGTDGSGIEIIRELELYVEAGMTPAEALTTATIMPARIMGVEKKTGSIKVGKVADLVLIDGDPSVRIGDLRQTRVVMLGDKLLDADALRRAAGFSGRPK
jgi:imidazolonepropionase-like amidohydrolase